MTKVMTMPSVTDANKQVMEQFIRFINTGDKSIGEAIISCKECLCCPSLS